MENSKKFIVGNTYKHNFISDSSCWVFYVVVRRTAKTIWIEQTVGGEVRGRTSSFRIFDFDGFEAIRPEGSYSMAPIMSSEKIVQL